LVVARPEGLYCAAGDFYIDPWRPVDKAVITHAHADHARTGSTRYISAAPGEGILRSRLGRIVLHSLAYGETLRVNDVQLSLHPAGHVLGSAQVRIEHKGEVWVVSGDYKVESDPTCAAFEPIPCHTFVTESTFGLPVYKWVRSAELFADINAWWAGNAAQGRASVLFCYSFGKAQRVLAGVDSSIGPIVTHGAVEPLNRVYREAGVALPLTRLVSEIADKTDFSKSLVIAPPSAAGSPWMKRFGDYSDAFASGWMLIRGARRRRAVDKGFVMSDHADWPGLNSAIKACGASTVYVTHGYVPVMVRWLQEQGLQALSFETKFGEDEDGQ
jgi:putative mRNA 3-end processing factor